MNIQELKDIPSLVEKQSIGSEIQQKVRILVSFVAIINNLNNSQTFISCSHYIWATGQINQAWLGLALCIF